MNKKVQHGEHYCPTFFVSTIKQELKDQTKTELQRQLLALEETRIDYQDSIKLYAPKTKFTNTNIDIAKLVECRIPMRFSKIHICP